MLVMILRKTPRSLRGELSKWLLEITPGVFAGRTSALVRDLLWEKVLAHRRTGRCYQLFPAQNEQGFEIRSSHTELRGPVQIDGLDLIATKTAAWRNKGHESGVGRQGHKARKS